MMRLCYLFILMLHYFVVLAQTHDAMTKVSYEVKSQNIDKQTIYLHQLSVGIIDSLVNVSAGVFNLPESIFPIYSLSVKGTSAFRLFVDERNGQPIHIVFDAPFEQSRTFIDGGLRTDMYQRAKDSCFDLRRFYSKKIQSAPRYNDDIDAIKSKWNERTADLFRFHLRNDIEIGVALIYAQRKLLFSPRFSPSIAAEFRDTIHARCSEALLEHQATKTVLSILETLASVRSGSELLDFELYKLSGDTIHTSSFRGEYLVVNFWATWCGPCLKKNRLLAKHYVDFKKFNIQVLGVQLDFKSMDYSTSLLDSEVALKYSFPWPNVFLFANQETKEIMDFYKSHSLPSMHLVSPDGVIILEGIKSAREIIAAVQGDSKKRGAHK